MINPQTAFLQCVSQNDIAGMEVLRNYVDVNGIDGLCNWSPLGRAIRFMNDDVVKWLLAHPDIDLNKLSLQCHPLWQASACDGIHYTIYTHMLVKHPRIHINYQDNHGWTAAMIAASLGNMDVLQTLIDHRADLDLKSNSDHNCGCVAADRSNFSLILNRLVDAGFDMFDAHLSPEAKCAYLYGPREWRLGTNAIPLIEQAREMLRGRFTTKLDAVIPVKALAHLIVGFMCG